MRQIWTLLTLTLGGLVSRSALATTSAVVAPAGGLDGLAVSVDVAAKEVRYASCRAAPCAASAASPAVAIPAGDTPLDANTVSVTDVALAVGRHLVRVKVPLGPDSAPEAPAWEALFVAGSPPLFAGVTGWSRGEPGERSGTDVRLLVDGDHNVVVIGEIREDLRICGDDATLLDPRGLDPRTLTFHGATFQRLDASRRDAAIAIEAVPRRTPHDPALAPLLAATDASSSRDNAAALTDGDLATAWSEARAGRGQGEFVLLRAPFDVPIVRFAVTVAPSAPRAAGAAPSSFYLATGAGTYAVTLPEDAWSHPGEAYDITLPKPFQSSCVALVLDDAFTRGKAHPEVTIAELTAYSTFDHAGATLADVAAALKGGDARADAAAALLERAGASGELATSGAYATLDASGRALAINVAASASSCASSGALLVAALGDADEVVRAKALTKLSEPACGRESLPALLDALKTPAARSRVAPLVALLGRDAAMAPLVSILGEGTADDRDAVRAAVAHASQRTTAADLSAFVIGDRSADARLDLLRALDGRLVEVPSVADASIATLLAGTPVLTTRYLLLDVIARLAAAGDADARSRLADLALHDAAREVRAHAIELLNAAGNSAVVAAQALGDPEPRVREAALHVVGALKLADATPRATDLLAHDPWTFVRVAAADTLGALPATRASDRALADTLDQLSPRVREGAILALARRNARSYAGAIEDRLTDAKEDASVHVAAARALGLLCNAKSTDLLVHFALAGASSPDPAEVAVGLVATVALGKLHPADLASRFAPLHAKGVRPDARTAADRAMADPLHCALP